jgi:GT2 family glycosyltransferase
VNKPLVSICLPTYNYARYLPESITSCLNQTYESLEIIIVDDGSTDNSQEVIRSFADPRIRFVQNPVRLGLVKNWNKTLSLVQGEIVKYIFADDILAEDAIERMVAALDNPGVDLVFCSAKIIDAQGHHTRTHQPYPQSKYLPGADEAKRCLKEGNYIGAPSAVAIRTRAFHQVGKFNETLGYQCDQEMWIRVLLKGDGYFLSDALASTRQHDGSETSRLERTRQIESETIKFLSCCMQNKQIRALLSKSDVRELTERCRALSGSQNSVDLSFAAHWERYAMRARESLRYRTPRYLKNAFRPAYEKIVAFYRGKRKRPEEE